MMAYRLLLCITAFLMAATAMADNPLIPQTETYRRLKSQIDQIRLIDTHEHLPNEAERLKEPVDFLAEMLTYVESDLVSSGMPRASDILWKTAVQDPAKPFDKRWAEFEQYWPRVRLTGYGRALQRAARDLYGVDLSKLTPETGRLLNQRMGERLKPGFYRWVLKEKARIDISILDIDNVSVLDLDKPYDAEFFLPTVNFDNAITMTSAAQVEDLAKRTGVKIAGADDVVKAMDAALQKRKRDGAVGVKSWLAYLREIYYPLPAKQDAEAAMQKLLGKKPATPEELRPLHNYLMHQVCQLAGKHHLPFQFHTGLQTGFFPHRIVDTKATHFVNLISAYPDTKFVIFHGSYPYGSELATMAKNFPNVYLDMCWLHVISPKVAREYLSEWIETVPCNKITAFGADYTFVEGAYAHAEMARENVAWVLAEKVLSGYMTEADAIDLATRVLRTNAIELYQLRVK